jgi:hypothetical protein
MWPRWQDIIAWPGKPERRHSDGILLASSLSADAPRPTDAAAPALRLARRGWRLRASCRPRIAGPCPLHYGEATGPEMSSSGPLYGQAVGVSASSSPVSGRSETISPARVSQASRPVICSQKSTPTPTSIQPPTISGAYA